MTGDDYARLGDDAESLVSWLDNTAFMRLESAGDVSGTHHHCAALTIDPALGSLRCSIYERRPQICRDLERGSPECLGELASKAERPRRALAVLSASGRTSR